MIDTDKTYTLNKGVEFVVDDAVRDDYLNKLSEQPIWDRPDKKQHLQQIFEARYVDLEEESNSAVSKAVEQPDLYRPNTYNPNQFYYEQEIKARNEAFMQDNIFMNAESEDDGKKLKAASKLAMYQYLGDFSEEKAAAKAKSLELELRNVEDAIGRPLNPDEVAMFVAQNEEKQINEMLDESASDIPLKLLANPDAQRFLSAPVLKMAIAKWQADHPRPTGFFGEFGNAWERARVQGNIKEQETNAALMKRVATLVENEGMPGVAAWLKDEAKTGRTYNDIATEMNMADIVHGTEGGAGYATGEVLQGIVAPYQTWLGAGALVAGSVFGRGKGFDIVNTGLNSYDYFQNNSFDIAYAAAAKNPELQKDFSDTILKAAPYAAAGALTEGVESAIISKGLGNAAGRIYKKLKSNAGKAPTVAAADGKAADAIEKGAENLKKHAFGEFLKGFGTAYATAFGTQSVVTASQGAITQYGINQLSGQDASIEDAAVAAVRDNLGVIAALSVIPGGLNGLSRAISQKNTAQALKEHNARLESEAVAAASPINKLGPDAANIVFTLTDDSQYRISASDLLSAIEAKGMTLDDFMAKANKGGIDFSNIKELAQTGGDLVISKADWEARYSKDVADGADSLAYELMNPFIRTAKTQLTLDELKQKLSPESFEKMTQELIDEINNENLTNNLANHIRHDITSQMLEKGLSDQGKADFISAMTADLYQKLAAVTGLDGIELYKRYAPSFEAVNESYNLTGKERATDKIGSGGGAYSINDKKFILRSDANMSTIVHEFGHSYLATLERIVADKELDIDKSRIEQQLNDIKQALGFKVTDAIDENMHERFTAALLASIVGDRSDLAGKSNKRLHAVDGAKFNASFSRLKYSIANSLSKIHPELDKKLTEEGNKDKNKELALQEYRERFDPDFDISPELRDFMTSHVLGRIAFDQHAQLAGLHPVLDAAILKQMDPELASELDALSKTMVDENTELQSMYTRLERVMIEALRRGSKEFDKLKQEMIDAYYNEKHQQNNFDDLVAAELDKRRREFMKQHKDDAVTNEQIEAAAKEYANKATVDAIQKVKAEQAKQLKKNISSQKKLMAQHFKAYDLLTRFAIKARGAIRNGGDIATIEKDFMQALENVYGKGSEAMEIIARQGPLFKVVLNEDGSRSLGPVHLPFDVNYAAFAAKNPDGTLKTVKHRATEDSPSYQAIVPDRDLINSHFDQKLNEQQAAIDADTTITPEAQQAYDASYSKALASKDLPTADGLTVGQHMDAMRKAAADEYIESIRDNVAKEIEESSASGKERKSGAHPDELKPVLELIDTLKALNEETPEIKRLREQAMRKLDNNPAWHIMQYMVQLDEVDKINYDDAKRLLGEQTANRLLMQGSASKDGTVTLSELGKDGPIRGALGDADSIIERECEAAWQQLQEASGIASMGLKKPKQMTDMARGLAIARALASFGTRTADEVVNETVQRQILAKSKNHVIDSLKYNKSLIGLTRKAFLRVNRQERAIINKMLKDTKAKTETDIKRLSDSLIARHKLSDLKIERLVSAGGRARDKAQYLVSKIADGPHVLQQISNLLNIDAVNKMAAHDAKIRIEAVSKKIANLKDLFTRPADKAPSYDFNHLLIGRVIASRIGLVSSAEGNTARALLRHAPEDVRALLEQFESDTRFSGDLMLKTLPEVESIIQNLSDLSDYSKAVQKQRMEGNKDVFASQSAEIIKQMDTAFKPIEAYAEKDGARSWGASPFKNAKRFIIRTFNSYLTKMEQYCTYVDGADNGPMTRFIYRPIREAYDRAQAQKLQAQKEANVIIQRAGALENKGIIKTSMKDKNDKVISFGMTGRYKGNGTMELLTFLTHIGNTSNRKKLLDGMGIKEDDFLKWFDEAQNDGTITKEMLDVVQSYWDFNSKYWPALQDAYYRASGKYATEVVPQAFETKFGTYSGGYAPAIRDADMTTGPLDRTGNLETLITGNALGEFFGEAGVLKNRNEAFAQQLRLDFGSQLSSTISVIHYSHMLDPATKLYRMVNDSQNNLREAWNVRNPEFVEKTLVPWLSRALRDSSSNSPVSGPFFNFLRTMTNRIGMSYMFGNLSNAVQGLTNFVVAAGHIGPGHIIRNMARMCYDYGNMRNEMMEQSQHMRARFESNIDKSIEETMRMTLAKSRDRNGVVKAGAVAYEGTKQFMNHNGYFLQTLFQHAIDTVIWTAARDEGVARKMSDTDAIAYADASIRMTQGSMDAIDLNNVEAGGPVLKMFTQFTSYFNTLLNLIAVNLRRNLGNDAGRIRRASRAAYVLSTVMIIPAILSDWIAEAFKGNNVFTDSEDWEDFMFKHAMMPTLKMGSAMVPVYGNAANLAAAQLTGGQAFGGLIGTPATIGAADSTLKLLRATWNGNTPNSPWKDSLTVLGMLSGIPAGTALGRRIDYATKVDVNSFSEALRLICSGDMSNDEKETIR